MFGVLATSIIAAASMLPFNYQPTPEAAAVHVLQQAGPVAVVRVNIAGRFAAVQTRGGVIESTPVDEALLLERFSFGWQPLDVIEAQCTLTGRNIDAATRRALLRGIPAPHHPQWAHCSEPSHDVGPPEEVDAVRHQMKYVLVPFVIVSGRYALGQWYGFGGGETIFRFERGTWHIIAGGGGAHRPEELRALGVSESALRAFSAALR